MLALTRLIFFTSVPIPLRYLSESEIEKKSELTFLLVVPVGVFEIFIFESVFLVIRLPLPFPLPVLNLFMVDLFESRFGSQLIPHLYDTIAGGIHDGTRLLAIVALSFSIFISWLITDARGKLWH